MTTAELRLIGAVVVFVLVWRATGWLFETTPNRLYAFVHHVPAVLKQ